MLVVIASCKVALRKGSTRPRLQVFLETNSSLLVWKLHRNHEGPWTMLDGMTRRAVVVPLEPVADVVRDPDVAARRVRLTAQNVDDSLFDAVHAYRKRQRSSRHD